MAAWFQELRFEKIISWDEFVLANTLLLVYYI